jgi:hypothetical protein
MTASHFCSISIGSIQNHIDPPLFLNHHPRREASRDAAAARPATNLLFVKRFTSPPPARREATRLNRVGRSDPCLGGGWGLSRKKARTRGKLWRPGRRPVQCNHCIIECSIELQLCRKSAILYCEQGKRYANSISIFLCQFWITRSKWLK